MRKQLGKELKKRFEAELKRVAPEFKAGTPPSPGVKLYERRLPSGFSTFILLDPDHRYDRFAVEIGWTHREAYPIEIADDVPPVDLPEIVIRAPQLWGGEGLGQDLYWELAPLPDVERPESFFEDSPLEAALEKVAPAVDEAIRRIQQHVLPYLERAMKAHGG